MMHACTTEFDESEFAGYVIIKIDLTGLSARNLTLITNRPVKLPVVPSW